MAKKNLLSKLMGKQDSGCCSVSFEEISEEEANNEGHEERLKQGLNREADKTEAGERHKAADESH